jgi:hypothetical protein
VHGPTNAAQTFKGTDRLKFSAEEQARILDAEQRHGYRREQEPEVRRSGGLGAGLATLIIWLLLEALVAPFVVHTHSNLRPSRGLQTENQSVHGRSTAQRTQVRRSPSLTIPTDRSTTPVAAPAAIMPEIGARVEAAIESRTEAGQISSDDVETSITRPRAEDEALIARPQATIIEEQPEPKPSTEEPSHESSGANNLNAVKEPTLERPRSVANGFASTSLGPEANPSKARRPTIANKPPLAYARRGLTGNAPRLASGASLYFHPCVAQWEAPSGRAPRPGRLRCFARRGPPFPPPGVAELRRSR